MKISELSTEKGLDVLCELVPQITDICADDKFIETATKKVAVNTDITDAEIRRIGVERINLIATYLLKNKRNSVIKIIAILNGKTEKEVAEQSLLSTIKEVVEIINDEDMMAFFTSFVHSGETK